MTGRTWGGVALLSLAAFMLLGFLRSSASVGPAAIGALLITVVLPAVGGLLLIRGVGTADRARVAKLRQQTIDAEILKMAVAHAGKLTAVEVAAALALTPEG